MTTNEKTYRWPKTLGARIDRLYTLREERLRMNKLVDAIKAEETALTNELINNIDKQTLDGASGKLARFGIIHKVVPKLDDPMEALKWASKNKLFIFQRRLNDKLVNELWEDGKQVRGVGTFDAIKTSLTKVSR